MTDSERIEVGLVTLPAEAGLERETLEIARRWKADAVRNSDGTQLSAELRQAAFEVYSTVCFIREDQEWARAHCDELIQRYLLSPAVTAVAETVEIDLLKPYFREQFAIDRDHDPRRWWEVIDRTSGAVVAPSAWTFDPTTETVKIALASPWHVYTVSFLVCQIWDPTSMYNHITNGWTSEHALGVNPYHPAAGSHLLARVKAWLANIPGDLTREMRLFPYFFPDVFKPGGDPTGIARANWVKIRRALLRKSVDRIGCGGPLAEGVAAVRACSRVHLSRRRCRRPILPLPVDDNGDDYGSRCRIRNTMTEIQISCSFMQTSTDTTQFVGCEKKD
jgi:hypothetical protein